MGHIAKDCTKDIDSGKGLMLEPNNEELGRPSDLIFLLKFRSHSDVFYVK